jgi:hypothetical protein
MISDPNWEDVVKNLLKSGADVHCSRSKRYSLDQDTLLDRYLEHYMDA